MGVSLLRGSLPFTCRAIVLQLALSFFAFFEQVLYVFQPFRRWWMSSEKTLAANSCQQEQEKQNQCEGNPPIGWSHRLCSFIWGFSFRVCGKYHKGLSVQKTIQKKYSNHHGWVGRVISRLGRKLLLLAMSMSIGCSHAAPSDSTLQETHGEIIPADMDRLVGYYMACMLTSFYTPIDNSILCDRMKEIGERVHRASDCPERPMTFIVLNEPFLRSPFATFGGFIYVPTGFLDLLRNIDELAYVLGHEIAHVCAQHPARNLEMLRDKGKVIQLFSEIVSAAGSSGVSFVMPTTGIPPLYEPMVSQVVSVLGGSMAANLSAFSMHYVAEIAIRGYSRDHEEQADRLGFGYGKKAGYDPRGIVEFWRRFNELKGRAQEEEFRENKDFSSVLPADFEDVWLTAVRIAAKGGGHFLNLSKNNGLLSYRSRLSRDFMEIYGSGDVPPEGGWVNVRLNAASVGLERTSVKIHTSFICADEAWRPNDLFAVQLMYKFATELTAPEKFPWLF